VTKNKDKKLLRRSKNKQYIYGDKKHI